MTTLFQIYRDSIKSLIESPGNFPAIVETSTVRAFTREDGAVLVLHSGKEVIVDEAMPRVTRVRELLCSVHTRGEDGEDVAEAIFEALQPIVMGYTEEGIVQIDEFGTDEPKFVPGDLTRALVTKRFRITYQTLSDSLAQ